MLTFLVHACHGCLDLVLPERCVLCDRQPGGEAVMLSPGPKVPGLRVWDRPHLCQSCFRTLQGQCPRRMLRGRDGLVVPAVAGLVTDQRLVTLVGALKYHGLRGVAWPLASLAARARQLVREHMVDHLVALPLHPGRRRERGFNQAALLARLLARDFQADHRSELLRRWRRTRQQARLCPSFAVRFANVKDAFRAEPSPVTGGGRVGLVDDIITSGATIMAAAEALTAAGWQVPWALAVGMSARTAGEDG